MDGGLRLRKSQYGDCKDNELADNNATIVMAKTMILIAMTFDDTAMIKTMLVTKTAMMMVMMMVTNTAMMMAMTMVAVMMVTMKTRTCVASPSRYYPLRQLWCRQQTTTTSSKEEKHGSSLF